MLNWLKFNKKHPNFWQIYLENIDKKNERTIVISLETSNATSNENLILSIAALGINNNMVDVSDCFEAKIINENRPINNIESNDFDNISLINETKIEMALENFVNFIKNAIIVGHRIDFDLEIINDALKKINCGNLKNQALDLEIMFRKLNQISETKKIDIKNMLNSLAVEKSDRNGAIFDAYDLSIGFLKMKSKLGF